MPNSDDAHTNHPAMTVSPEDEQIASRTRELYARYAESQHPEVTEPTRKPAARRRTGAKRSRANVHGTPHAAPTHDEIAYRAYQLYKQSGCQPDREVEFWLEAERQLTGLEV